jgi:hypothetical protein
MSYTDIINMIAEALKDSHDGLLLDIRQDVQELLMTDDERAALEALIDAALDSIGREAA